jgi:hypothetical protein
LARLDRSVPTARLVPKVLPVHRASKVCRVCRVSKGLRVRQVLRAYPAMSETWVRPAPLVRPDLQVHRALLGLPARRAHPLRFKVRSPQLVTCPLQATQSMTPTSWPQTATSMCGMGLRGVASGRSSGRRVPQALLVLQVRRVLTVLLAQLGQPARRASKARTAALVPQGQPARRASKVSWAPRVLLARLALRALRV